jgi:Uma2 family endonuclease
MTVETIEITPLEAELMAKSGSDIEEQEKVASFRHGVICMRLGRRLAAYVDDRKLGYVSDSSADFKVADGTKPMREPDVAFVSLEKMPEPLDEEVPFAPDLAVEVISRTDDWSAIVAKANEYLAAGTQLVWVVDQYGQGVFVFRPDQRYHLLTLDDELDGEDIVPGFKLGIKTLFE